MDVERFGLTREQTQPCADVVERVSGAEHRRQFGQNLLIGRVTHGNAEARFRRLNLDLNRAAVYLWRDAVFDGILHQGLEYEAGNAHIREDAFRQFDA